MIRLQRKDLAKDFEELVQQEVKNHNDSILATNVSINDMRSRIKILSDTVERNAQQSHQLFMGITSSIDAMKESFETSIHRVNCKIGDCQNDNHREIEAFKKSTSDRESYFLTIKDFETFHAKIDEWMSQIRMLFEKQNHHLTLCISKASEAHIPAVEQAKSSFRQECIDNIEQVKEINKSLDIFAVNFQSLKKEIEVYKKNNFVIEKNIENIYTQIERLKENK